MFSLILDDEQDSIEYEGELLAIDTTYDNILKVMDLAKNDLFEDWEKLIIMYQLLVLDYEKYEYNILQVQEIVHRAIELFKTQDGKSDEPVFDFEEDAARIYASFLKAYDIDLKAERGKMSWFTFMGLLNTLTEDTPLMKAIGYRVMEIPSADKIGQDERRRLQKLKQAYELKAGKERREQEMLANMLKRQEVLEKRSGKDNGKSNNE